MSKAAHENLQQCQYFQGNTVEKVPQYKMQTNSPNMANGHMVDGEACPTWKVMVLNSEDPSKCPRSAHVSKHSWIEDTIAGIPALRTPSFMLGSSVLLNALCAAPVTVVIAAAPFRATTDGGQHPGNRGQPNITTLDWRYLGPQQMAPIRRYCHLPSISSPSASRSFCTSVKLLIEITETPKKFIQKTLPYVRIRDIKKSISPVLLK